MPIHDGFGFSFQPVEENLEIPLTMVHFALPTIFMSISLLIAALAFVGELAWANKQ